MAKNIQQRRWPQLRVLGSLALPLLLPLGTALGAEQRPVQAVPALISAQPALPAVTPSPNGDTTITQVAAPTYTLADCIQIALSRQPAMNAARSSLAAAQTGYCALANLRVPTFLAPDLPFRRQQACIGISIASAALDQTEHETIYAV